MESDTDIRVAISVAPSSEDPLDAASAILSLKSTLRRLQPEGLEFISEGAAERERDPLVVGVVFVTIVPVLLVKFLSLVKVYVERNKGAVIKVSFAGKDGRSIKIEAPYNYSPEELGKLIESMGARLNEVPKKSSKR